jgi:C4-dicarboxylate transporter, DctM subunit
MEPVLAALVTIVVMFVLLASGAWVFVALILTCLVSLYFLAGFPIHRIGAIAEPALVKSVTSWELAAVPLFLWMGEMLNRSGLSFRLYRGLTPWLRGLPGGLLHTNIGGCVLFAAVSGSSVATTATIGQVTTRALRERNYDVGLSVGSIAAAGSIGIMIPPSLTMIIYGLIAEVSIARLFAAGMIPGLMLGALYSGYVLVRCLANPSLAPREPDAGGWPEALRGLRDLLPVFFLILLVLGGIYSGTATPSEAAALGVAGTILVSLPSREFGLGAFLHSALAAARTTAMLGTIFAAAKMLSTTMGLLHLPHTVAAWIDGLGLSPYGLIFVLGVFYVLLGCVLESIAMILMTMPIAFPLVVRAGFDPVWFGVFIVLVVEMGLITPPIGFNLFVIRGITGYPIATIARGALPFFGLMLVGAFLITAFPGIALWLPRVLFG